MSIIFNSNFIMGMYANKGMVPVTQDHSKFPTSININHTPNATRIDMDLTYAGMYSGVAARDLIYTIVDHYMSAHFGASERWLHDLRWRAIEKLDFSRPLPQILSIPVNRTKVSRHIHFVVFYEWDGMYKLSVCVTRVDDKL